MEEGLVYKTDSGSNLCHQLMQREIDVKLQGNSKTFKAHLFRERYRLAKNLYKTDLRAHYGCVNAIEFSKGGKYLASGGDDKRVLIWDIEMAIAGNGRPRTLNTEHTSNIFCLGFDRHNRAVFSGGNDDLVIMHDFETGKLINIFKHDNPVYGLSIDPQCDNIFATACEDGQILVFDQRIDPTEPFVVAQLRASFHAVEFHPAGGNFLISANTKRGAALWDIRKPLHPVIQYGHVEDSTSCMSVRFNSTGSLILALRRRLPPILFNTQSPEPICTFYHGNYYNSCTMKSCTFAGEDDEFVLSGSDDFNLYVWRVSDVNLERVDQWIETTQMVLYGHRSIVNQVRYNRQKCLLASSGVEKIVKLWSPFAQHGWTGSLLEEATCSDSPRDLYSPYNINSMSTQPHSWSHMSHDYSSRNTHEDPRMMAFFDSLIQQEIEGWETNSSTDSPGLSTTGSATHSSSNNNSDTSFDDDDDNDDDDDDDDDANGGLQERVNRRAKRQLIRRKAHKRRHRSGLRKKKVSRNKYANRIAYLIATKRNTLRRLAIKGASLNNRYPLKIIKKTAGSKLARKRTRHSPSLPNRNFTCSVKGSSTSNVAASSISFESAASTSTMCNYRSQRRKHKKNRVYDTSSDDENEPSSSRYSGLPFSNNLPVPSTSTGITSSFKDDIMRLRRQQQHIIDSDEDDDDDQVVNFGSSRSSNHALENSTIQPTKKLNGVRRTNDGANAIRSGATETIESTAITDEATPDSPSMHRNQEAASMRTTSDDPNNTANIRNPCLSATIPQCDDATNSNATTNSINSRRRPHADSVDNNYSNSRLLTNSYQDDMLDSLASSSSDLTMAPNCRQNQHQQNATPLKRRKLDISAKEEVQDHKETGHEQVKFRLTDQCISEINGTTPTSEDDDDQCINHTLKDNCDLYLRQEDDQNDNDIATPSSSHFIVTRTPDSGISVSTTIQSCIACHSDESVLCSGHNNNDEIASTSSGQRLSPGFDNLNATKSSMSTFQQKVALVRRNYRKKFAEESDSD